ncbi:MAG: AbrB family transcriptional regulator [Rhodomicrobium sp.]
MSRLSLDRLPPALQWLLLASLSAAFAAALHWAGMPAAFFLGPMAGGVILGVYGGTVRVPPLPFTAAQAIMGLFIASAITPAILRSFIKDWPVFLGAVFSILGAASLLGWTMARSRVMPATTSIWGCWPGGAGAMVVMAAEFGADARLVAFMQYFRVACVAGLASAVAAIVTVHGGAALPAIQWFPPVQHQALAETLLIAAAGALAGRVFRIPSGPMLVTLALGAILHVSGAVEFELPKWLLTGTYALLGWSVGLHFTPAIVAHALRAFPKVLLNVVLLIGFSASVGYLLTWTLGIDALTAYLATSPGGMDSVAIIAASSDVDLPFVMTLQTIRFLVIVTAGPPVARLLARQLKDGAGQS